MLVISKAQWDAIPADYNSDYEDYTDKHVIGVWKEDEE